MAAIRTILQRSVLVATAALMSVTGFAQIDTEYWFAPPEVDAEHGDKPILLRLSTLDQAADVTVQLPARDTVIAQASISANSTKTIDLTALKSQLETYYEKQVMQTGMQIISTAPISAYYEIEGHANADIFVLKGRNALGNKFVIPVQDLYDNDAFWAPILGFSFDVVATQDNTIVTVRPTLPIHGYLPGNITVVLNAGETYSFRKNGRLASENPGGSIVESSKPIAITLKDDSAVLGEGCADLLGDQTVPVEVAGSEYVIIRGHVPEEFIFMTAIEDQTQIFVDGGESPIATLSAGQVYRYPITNPSTYVSSTRKIYVLHVTGIGCEAGMAVLPAINCRGSQQIGFSRTTEFFFGLNILCKKDGIDNFTLNGSRYLVEPSMFSPVTGTEDVWYTAQITFHSSQIRVGQANLISNSATSFQLGILTCTETTCGYGYFSAFSTLFIGDDMQLCEGEVLTLDAGPGKDSYLWSTGETSEEIAVTSPGEYFVGVTRKDCTLYDTITVGLRDKQIDVGPDVLKCPGELSVIDGLDNFRWEWSDGSTDRFLETTDDGVFWLTVLDWAGCIASDTLEILLKGLPPADLGPDIVKCKHDEVTLDASTAGATYRWQDGLTAPSRAVTEEGTYVIYVSRDGCTNTDSIAIENLPGPPQDSIYGTPSVCPYAAGIQYSVDAIPNSTFQWFVNGGVIASTHEYEMTADWHDTNATAGVKAVVTDGSGCRGDTIRLPVRINVMLLPEMPSGPETLCINKGRDVEYFTPPRNGSHFQWNIDGGEIISGQGKNKIRVRWTEGRNQLWIDETSTTIDTVCFGTSPPLEILVYKDTLNIALDYVSVDTVSATTVHIAWTTTNPALLGDRSIDLNKRPSDTPDWHLVASLPSDTRDYEDQVDFTTDAVLEYHLSAINSCDEQVITAVHNNIFLSGVADSDDVISLNWSHYFGWPDGVSRYEIWRKADAEPGYRLLTTLSPFENSYSAAMATDAFDHRYLIRAVSESDAWESWSNPVSFEFEHPVTIYNIITANGDARNDYFHITNIELYHRSVLTIVDRWGKVVFRTVNYQNDWDAKGLASGVYFYKLELNEGRSGYKGPVTVLH